MHPACLRKKSSQNMLSRLHGRRDTNHQKHFRGKIVSSAWTCKLDNIALESQLIALDASLGPHSAARVKQVANLSESFNPEPVGDGRTPLAHTPSLTY